MATLLLVESWLQSTGRSLPPLIRAAGHEYVLLTRDPTLYPDTPDGPHPVIGHADEITVADTNDINAAVQAARVLALRRRIDGVLTTCDYYLEAAAVIARALNLPGPSPEVMRVATRKHLVRDVLHEAGISQPAYAAARRWPVAHRAATRLGFPLVAKPVDLNSGTSVRCVDDEAALKDAFWDVASLERNTRGQPMERLLLMEKRLDGREVSVEAVTIEGETTVVGVTDKVVLSSSTFVEAGHMFPAQLDPPTAGAVQSVVQQALDAIGYEHGISHTEIMITDDGPQVVEINPRQSGGYIFDLVQLVTGMHPLQVLVDLALGKPPQIGTPAEPLTTMNEPAASAAVSFIMSPWDTTLRDVKGTDALDADPHVHRWEIRTSGHAERPRDNNTRLGYVLTVDPHGRQAARYARAAIHSLKLDLDGRGLVRPLIPD